MAAIIELRKARGHVSRKLNVYEHQIEEAWVNGDIAVVHELIDGWVRTAAAASDLKSGQVDEIIEQICAQVAGWRVENISPFAAVEEVRSLMTLKGLNPILTRT